MLLNRNRAAHSNLRVIGQLARSVVLGLGRLLRLRVRQVAFENVEGVREGVLVVGRVIFRFAGRVPTLPQQFGAGELRPRA